MGSGLLLIRHCTVRMPTMKRSLRNISHLLQKMQRRNDMLGERDQNDLLHLQAWK